MKCGQPQLPGTLSVNPGTFLPLYIYTHITVDVLQVGSVRENSEFYEVFTYTNHHNTVFTNTSHIILTFVQDTRNAYKSFGFNSFKIILKWNFK
jgi:hypothetical protein